MVMVHILSATPMRSGGICLTKSYTQDSSSRTSWILAPASGGDVNPMICQRCEAVPVIPSSLYSPYLVDPDVSMSVSQVI